MSCDKRRFTHVGLVLSHHVICVAMFLLKTPWVNFLPLLLQVIESYIVERRQILCGYGYSSFEPTKAVYGDIKFLPDVWECVLVSAEKANALRDDNPSILKIVYYEPSDCFNVLRAHVVSKPELRKFLTDLCPPGRTPGRCLS